MKSLMEEEGLPYGNRTRTWNSRLAQELGAWADTQENGQALHDILYRAYFVDNVNIGDPEMLIALTQAAGLDAAQARVVLETRAFSERIDADWRHAMESGVSGVPTFLSRDLYVMGCQSYEVLLKFINHLRTLN